MIVNFLFAAVIPLTLTDDLPAYIGKEVEIRGFLYETEEKQLLLATQPNIKTCCLNKGKTILVEGALTPSPFVVTLRGTLDRRGERVLLTEAEKIL